MQAGSAAQCIHFQARVIGQGGQPAGLREGQRFLGRHSRRRSGRLPPHPVPGRDRRGRAVQYPDLRKMAWISLSFAFVVGGDQEFWFCIFICCHSYDSSLFPTPRLHVRVPSVQHHSGHFRAPGLSFRLLNSLPQQLHCASSRVAWRV